MEEDPFTALMSDLNQSAEEASKNWQEGEVDRRDNVFQDWCLLG